MWANRETSSLSTTILCTSSLLSIVWIVQFELRGGVRGHRSTISGLAKAVRRLASLYAYKCAALLGLCHVGYLSLSAARRRARTS